MRGHPAALLSLPTSLFGLTSFSSVGVWNFHGSSYNTDMEFEFSGACVGDAQIPHKD
jgi:hypothetical protein